MPVPYLPVHAGALVTSAGGRAPHTQLEIIDTWRGHAGSRPLAAGAYRCGLYIDNGQVRIGGSTDAPGTHAFSAAKKYRERLEDGLCTHEEIRQVLSSAIRKASLLQGIFPSS